MTDPMPLCAADGDLYCDTCDVLVGLPGLRVISAARNGGWLTVKVESPRSVMGCPDCGVIAASHGRRTLLTRRVCWWAIAQLRAENASVLGLARQLGTTWATLWRAIKPLLTAMADDPDPLRGRDHVGRG